MTVSAAAMIAVSAISAPKTYELLSPDGNVKVEIEAGEGISYSLTHGNDLVLDKSAISMFLTDGTVYGGIQKVSKVSRRSVDQTVPAQM